MRLTDDPSKRSPDEETLGVEAEDKVDQHGDEQHHRENGGTQPVVVRTEPRLRMALARQWYVSSA